MRTLISKIIFITVFMLCLVTSLVMFGMLICMLAGYVPMPTHGIIAALTGMFYFLGGYGVFRLSIASLKRFIDLVDEELYQQEVTEFLEHEAKITYLKD